jgi:hypothetical protein
MTNAPQQSKLLPADARKMLADAAKVENTEMNPMARERAINRVTKRIKQMYPKYFRD